MAFPVFHKKTRRHRSHAVWEAPEETHSACIIFNVKRGAGESQRGFLQRFPPLLCGKLSNSSGTVKQTLFLASARLPLSDKWQLVSYQWSAALFHVGMEGGGGMWGASKAEEKKHCCASVPALIRGPRRRWQVYSVKKGAILTLRLSWGCCGQLETNRKPLEHEQRPAFRME